MSISIQQYHEFVGDGILTEDNPVELLEGHVVEKAPKTPAHRICTQQLRDLLARLLPPGWFVDDQEPITLSDSEPEPDVAVIRGKRTDYQAGHPGPGDVSLVVEVADSSLPRDRVTKRFIYAAAGIPVYWLINLDERCIEVFREPQGAGRKADYRVVERYVAGDEIALNVGEFATSLRVDDLLP